MARIPSIGRTFEAVTPSDTTKLSGGAADAFHVAGDAGTIAIVGEDGVVGNFYALQGAIIPCGGIRINATGTTATSIVAIYGRN